MKNLCGATRQIGPLLWHNRRPKSRGNHPLPPRKLSGDPLPRTRLWHADRKRLCPRQLLESRPSTHQFNLGKPLRLCYGLYIHGDRSRRQLIRRSRTKRHQSASRAVYARPTVRLPDYRLGEAEAFPVISRFALAIHWDCQGSAALALATFGVGHGQAGKAAATLLIVHPAPATLAT